MSDEPIIPKHPPSEAGNSGELFDFWFSQKSHDTRLVAIKNGVCRPFLNFFKGQEYSEMCNAGRGPSGVWGDYVLLGTGTWADVTSTGIDVDFGEII